MKLLIDEVPLKQFLNLFNPGDEIDLRELGDTWHPSSGFANKSILGRVEKVRQIIDFDYDFEGLVLFDAVIADLRICYSDQLYTITGGKQQIEKIVSKVKAWNTNQCSPKYNYRLI